MFRASRIVSLAVLSPLAVAQAKPSTWMNLAAGTDITYAVEDENKLAAGGGTGSGGAGRVAVRVVALGPDESGAPRIALFEEQLPKQSFETPIVRAEIYVLDAATGGLKPAGASGKTGPLSASTGSFPFPALSAAEWKAKKPVARTMVAPVAGEAQDLPFTIRTETKKDGKKQVPVLVAALDAKEPVTVKLAGIAGMVAMAQGQMPKLGASGIEPVDASLVALRREYTIDAKGNCSEVRTTGTVTAADGKLEIACSNVQRETARRVVTAKELPAFVEVVEELCAIVGSNDGKDERKARAEALQSKAKQAGFGETVARLLDSMSRSGLPPGVGR